MKPFSLARTLAFTGLFAGSALAQGTLADYQRGQGLQAKARGLVVNVPSAPNWIGESDHFWYSKAVKGGTEFVLVDATAGTKKPAFDHDRLASAISSASGGRYTGLTLPFAPALGGRGGGAAGRGGAGPTPGALTFSDGEKTVHFGASGFMYKCTLADYVCTKGEAISAMGPAGRGARGNSPEALEDDSLAAPAEIGGDPV